MNKIIKTTINFIFKIKITIKFHKKFNRHSSTLNGIMFMIERKNHFIRLLMVKAFLISRAKAIAEQPLREY